MSASNVPSTTVLADPRLWRELAHTVGRRVDGVEVDDVVQATLTEALAAKALPTADEAIRRFVFAIARQKVADVYRRRQRDRRPGPELLPVEPAPGADLKRWVERNLPKGASTRQTFEWMLREADGETLAEIALADGVSAPMVRQRVSRLRRWLRARWTKQEIVGLGAFMLVAIGVALWSLAGAARNESADEGIRPDEGVATALPPSRPGEVVPPELRPHVPRRRARPAPVPVLRPAGSATAAPSGDPKLRAYVTTKTESTRTASGNATSVTSYEVHLPKIDVSSCVTPSSPHGVSQISLTFRPDGTVETAIVDSGPIVGHAEAKCVERLYARVHMKPFSDRETYNASTWFTLVPEPPPAWTKPFDTPVVPTPEDPAASSALPPKPRLQLDENIWRK